MHEFLVYLNSSALGYNGVQTNFVLFPELRELMDDDGIFIGLLRFVLVW